MNRERFGRGVRVCGGPPALDSRPPLGGAGNRDVAVNRLEGLEEDTTRGTVAEAWEPVEADPFAKALILEGSQGARALAGDVRIRQLLCDVAELEESFDGERLKELLDRFVEELGRYGRSGDLDRLLSCLDATGDGEPGAGTLPDIWVKMSFANVDWSIRRALVWRPNREAGEARDQIEATLATGSGPEEIVTALRAKYPEAKVVADS